MLLAELLIRNESFNLGVKDVDTSLVSINDLCHDMWVIMGLLMEIHTDSNAELLLLWSQEITTRLRTNGLK